MPDSKKTIVVGTTGASGAPYAVRLIDLLESTGAEVHWVVSSFGKRLLAEECGITSVNVESVLGRKSNRVILHDYRNIGSILSTGSFHTDGMVVCPCSSNSLGAIAAGLGENLVCRAAHVTLKESRRLVLVHREMPLSGIDLENMLRLQRAGAIVCPAAPGFYLRPQTVADLVDFVVGRVLDLMGVQHNLKIRWQGE